MKTSNNGITMISVFEQYHDGNLQEIGINIDENDENNK